MWEAFWHCDPVIERIITFTIKTGGTGLPEPPVFQGNADESVSLAKIAGTKCLSAAIFCDPAGGF